MGRRKGFSREHVLETALPVFWKRGFADATLEELEQATGVRKSGLYAEFKDKSDLFIESLRHYLASLPMRKLLEVQPLGWRNIERFLKVGPLNETDKKGCFAVSCMRELSILPPEAQALIAQARLELRKLLVANLKADKPDLVDAHNVAELVHTFFTGDCIEISLQPTKAARERKIARFLDFLRVVASGKATLPQTSGARSSRTPASRRSQRSKL